MTQFYSNPARQNLPHALPDCEVFFISQDELSEYADLDSAGWYWWACFPGCLPDSDPIGPFDTESEAVQDAQSESWQFEEEE